ncbi:MAG TPA: VWA domain-containing protein [Candidatus Marinimicrobia bacterium]|nr:VWA domain-containing protein [Candidatus Neomarinimicrobiota bacterium]
MKKENKVLGKSAGGEEIAIPFKQTTLDGRISGGIGNFILTQDFQNGSKALQEIHYTFPIHPKAAVTGMRIEFEDRIIDSDIEELDKAFEQFEKATQKGDSAFLLDKIMDDLLLLQIGKLRPGEQCRVQVHYIQEFPQYDNQLRVTIPTSFSPRYSPAGSDPIMTDIINPGWLTEAPYRFILNLKIDPKAIESIQSVSHHIVQTALDNGEIAIHFQQEAVALDRDIVIDLKLSDESKEGSCFIAKNESGRQFGVLRFMPQFPESNKNHDEYQPADYIFIIDCSGSMTGSSIRTARQALEIAIRQLNKDDRFELITFESSYQLLFNKLTDYTTENFNKALGFIQNIDARLGGTELKAPLKSALKMKSEASRQKNIYLITDGQIGNDQEIKKLWLKNGQESRLFAFNIGYAPAHGILDTLADISGGVAENILPQDDLLSIVLRQFGRSNQPRVEDIKLHFQGLSVNEKKLPELRPIFENDTWTAYFQIQEITENAKIKLIGKLGDKELSWSFKPIILGTDKSISQLYGRQRIQQVKNDINLNHKNLIKLSKKYGVLSPSTSFVGILKRKGDEKAKGEATLTRVPLQLTKNFSTSPINSFIGAAACVGMPQALRRFTSYSLVSSNIFENFVSEDSDYTLLEMMAEPEENYRFIVKILSKQDLEGSFDKSILPLISDSLNQSDIEKVIESLGMRNRELAEKLIYTRIVILMIQNIQADPSICHRSLSKAKNWFNTTCKEQKLDKIAIINAAQHLYPGS